MKTTAVLLVIDVQNDFCPGGALAVPHGDEVVTVINRISTLFPLVVATRDWHPESHVSFASTYGRKPLESIDVSYGDQVLWPDHCVQGSPGARFHPLLDTRPFNLILHKGTHRNLDSYSAFRENDRTTPTGLQGYLDGLKVDTVYVCGLATDYCVLYSALDSAALGFTTFVIPDASRGVGFPEGSTERAFEHMERSGIRSIQSTEVR